MLLKQLDTELMRRYPRLPDRIKLNNQTVKQHSKVTRRVAIIKHIALRNATLLRKIF